MISVAYCRQMARYNAWQNGQIEAGLIDVSLEDLTADHGAFFGSILGTLNHLLWADGMWMSRFDARIPRPEQGIKDSPGLCPTLGVWSAERFQLDGLITRWAEELHTIDLAGRMSFYSGVLEREVTRRIGACVMHMFNHQTHHRGQVHAMMTRTGLQAPVTDLFLLPEEEEI